MYPEDLEKELMEREKRNSPIRVGIAGTGFVGRALINQLQLMKGIRIIALANRNPKKSITVAKEAPSPLPYSLCNTKKELQKEIQKGFLGIVSNPLLLASIDVDIIIDCTGDPILGTDLALLAIEEGKHFMAAPEMDATIGPILNYLFQKKGIIYSGAYGDEPGVIMELYRYVSLLGLEIVGAGKFKGYYNPRANPTSVKPWAQKYQQNPFMLSSFADGSKMNMEMAIIANATGLLPDVRGMHCPTTSLEEIPKILETRDKGGILEKSGVVEVILGVEPSGGVFVVARTCHPQIRSDLNYLKMGDGPNYLFYRPYHLCGMEMGITPGKILICHQPTIAPKGPPLAQVFAVAKRDLKKGERLDAIGGFTYYGLIDKAKKVAEERLLPLGLAKDNQLTKPCKIHEPITLDMVEISEVTNLYQLWSLQKQILESNTG